MFVSNIIIIEVKRDRKRDREIIFHCLIYNEFDIFETLVIFAKNLLNKEEKQMTNIIFTNISKITSKLIDSLFTNFIKIK